MATEKDTDWVFLTSPPLSTFKPDPHNYDKMNNSYQLISERPSPKSPRPALHHDVAMLRALTVRQVHPDQATQFADFASKIRHSATISEVVALLEKVSTKTLLDAIPQSLPVVEAIYSRFHVGQGIEFPKVLLKPDHLLSQLIWWLVKAQPSFTSPKLERNRVDTEIQIKILLPHLRSLLNIVQTECPELISQMRIKSERVEQALEGLGLHGLINYSNNKLIFVAEAARIELTTHCHRVKDTCHKMDKIWSAVKSNLGNSKNDGKFVISLGTANANLPSKSNHQRLLTLTSSQVHRRLQQNEAIIDLLNKSLENLELESLIRILRRRIDSDRDILQQLNSLRSAGQNCDSIFGPDPVVSRLLLQFRNAYERLLSLVSADNSPNQSPREDSGVDMGSDDLHCSSPDTMDEEQPHYTPKPARCVKKLGPVAQQLKSRLRHKKPLVHRSLVNLNQIDQIGDQFSASEWNLISVQASRIRPAKSLHNLSRPLSLDLDSFYPEPETMFPSGAHSKNHVEERFEIARLKNEVSKLNSQLARANERIQNLNVNPNRWPRQNQLGLESEMSGSALAITDSDFSALVTRYNNLFSKDRLEIMHQMNELPELSQSVDLQLKIIFSVIALAFRSVRGSIESKREKIWDILEIEPDEGGRDLRNLEMALNEFMRTRAKATHGMSNAKEVTAQIWKTLYDFPSLKCCTRFNRYILDCVDLAWELNTATNFKFRLEYDSLRFSGDKHLRFHTSFLKCPDIKRFVWPTLMDDNTGNVASKGIVIT